MENKEVPQQIQKEMSILRNDLESQKEKLNSNSIEEIDDIVKTAVTKFKAVTEKVEFPIYIIWSIHTINSLSLDHFVPLSFEN